MKIERIALVLLFLCHCTVAFAQSGAEGLFKAAESGNVADIRKALAQGVSVNAADLSGWTPLLVAAGEGQLAAVQALVKAGANVNAASKKGETALMAAVLSGNVAVVKYLLAEGADKSAATAKGLTAADIAEQAMKPEITKLLMPEGKAAPAAKAKVASKKQIDAKEAEAVEAYQKGRYDEAAGLFKELVGISPTSAEAWHFLGKSLEKSGEREDAAEAYKQSLEVEPSGDLAERNKRALTEVPNRWIKDAQGCALANPYPKKDETVTWSGLCNRGYAEGEGVVKFFNSGKEDETWLGRLVRGKRQGSCITTRPSGTREESNCENGIRVGMGKFTYSDGGFWEGTYTNGARTGIGKLTYSNGGTYEGEFVQGKLHGKGKSVLSAGTYEGEFVAGRMHGKGKWVSSGGLTYEGNFSNDKLEGHGVLTTSGGTRFEGSWTGGTMSGFFDVKFANGTWYKGEFRDNLPNGRGTAFIAGSGRTYTGTFVNGCYGDPADMYNRVAISVPTEKCGW